MNKILHEIPRFPLCKWVKIGENSLTQNSTFLFVDMGQNQNFPETLIR